MSIAALIVAGGRGIRFGRDVPKQFLPVGGQPVLLHSVEIFERMPEFNQVWLVLPAEWVAEFDRRYDLSVYSKIAGRVAGGARRQDSVAAGLKAMPPVTEIVAIHDAVRPFAAPEAIREAIARARRMGAAILAAPAVDTPKRCDRQGRVIETIPRDQLWLAQTPQVFRCGLIRRAYEKALADGVEVTDDAAAVERLGEPVEVVQSPRPNPKITSPEDLRFAKWLLKDARP
jgi:2-C-methyl-D-erythritol 4-phosphate cytidylyltransferase